MKRQPISRLELASYLLSPALFVMVTLMVVEAILAAATTWLVINAGRKVAIGQFLLSDLIWILTAQSASYVVGVISWIFAERAGYRGFGKFMLRFARENRGKVKLLNEKPLREGLIVQIRAIVAREGMSAMSGIVSLAIVFATISVVALQNAGDMVLLVGLATTLPRQIEMTYELHLLATGWNDFIAIWTRFGGVAANMLPEPDADFDKRIKFDRLVLR